MALQTFGNINKLVDASTEEGECDAEPESSSDGSVYEYGLKTCGMSDFIIVKNGNRVFKADVKLKNDIVGKGRLERRALRVRERLHGEPEAVQKFVLLCALHQELEYAKIKHLDRVLAEYANKTVPKLIRVRLDPATLVKEVQRISDDYDYTRPDCRPKMCHC